MVRFFERRLKGDWRDTQNFVGKRQTCDRFLCLLRFAIGGSIVIDSSVHFLIDHDVVSVILRGEVSWVVRVMASDAV